MEWNYLSIPKRHHSVEIPSVIYPQWNVLYRGSKWIFHTVCWDAVGCECGTTSVYFRITHVCFIPSTRPVTAVEPQYQHHFFVQTIISRAHTKSSKNSCRFKTLMGFVAQILIKLGTSSIWGFLWLPFDVLLGVTYANMLVATQWPLKRAPHHTSLAWVCVVWRSKSSLELSAPCE